MPLFPISRARTLCTHLRDTLRSNINTTIATCIASAPSATGLASIGDTTAQIEFGDSFDYEPLLYPSIRIQNPRIVMRPLGSASVTDAAFSFVVGVYVEQSATGEGECAADIIQELSLTALDLSECTRAALEQYFSSSTYGDNITCNGMELVDAPQDPEDPCKMRLKYELTFEVKTRLRQSRGA